MSKPEDTSPVSGTEVRRENHLDRELAALPEIPLSPGLLADVRRRARVVYAKGPRSALDGEGLLDFETPARPGTLAAVWTRTLLPTLLLVAGAMYTVTSFAGLLHIYLGH